MAVLASLRAPAADWQDAAAYSHVATLDGLGLAWEWLRRDHAYRLAAQLSRAGERPGTEHPGQAEGALEWGLHAFEDPRLDALLARPVWSAAHCGHVLRASALPGGAAADLVDLDRLAFAHSLPSSNCRHLLLSNGRYSIRLDVRGAPKGVGPVVLDYRISGLRSAEAPLLVLRQFLSLLAAGRFSPALHRPLRKAARHGLLLRTSDALASGASQRQIAAQLLDEDARAQGWRYANPSLRSRAQRLVRDARNMANGRFWDLL